MLLPKLIEFSVRLGFKMTEYGDSRPEFGEFLFQTKKSFGICDQ